MTPSVLGGVLERAQGFLIEPAAERDATPARGEAGGGRVLRPPPRARVEVAVLGLSPGCGVSTLARGLARSVWAVSRCPAHVAVFAAAGGPERERSGTAPVWEIPAGLADPEEVAGYGTMIGCLAGEPSVMIWDVPPRHAEAVAAVALRAQAVVVVAAGSGEPALAELAGGMLEERFGPVLLVANRVRDFAPWRDRTAACLPESRLGAWLARRGRRAPAPLAGALDELALAVLDGAEHPVAAGPMAVAA